MSVLTIENVQKKFKDGDTEIVALEKTSFTAEKGEIAGLISTEKAGINGSCLQIYINPKEPKSLPPPRVLPLAPSECTLP